MCKVNVLCFVLLCVVWILETNSGTRWMVLLWYFFLVIICFLYVCSISGTVAVLVTCPLEVVKTRFQSSIYTSLMRTVTYAPQCAYSTSAVHGTSCLAYQLPGKPQGALHSFLHKSPSGGFSRIWWFIGCVHQCYCFAPAACKSKR